MSVPQLPRVPSRLSLTAKHRRDRKLAAAKRRSHLTEFLLTALAPMLLTTWYVLDTHRVFDHCSALDAANWSACRD